MRAPKFVVNCCFELTRIACSVFSESDTNAKSAALENIAEPATDEAHEARRKQRIPLFHTVPLDDDLVAGTVLIQAKFGTLF